MLWAVVLVLMDDYFSGERHIIDWLREAGFSVVDVESISEKLS